MSLLMIMAGGTGGHVFPALAVAERVRGLGHEVRWLGTRHGFEAELVPNAGFAFDCIEVAGLRGNGITGWLAAPLQLTRAVLQALKVLHARRPDAVLGMGGFASGPGGVAARLLSIPLLVHEQNAAAGMTNRILARLANRVLEAFPGTFPAARDAVATGNPVRETIAAVAEPAERLTGRTGPLRLLVIGGSQGAAALNALLPVACVGLDTPIEILHQAGRGKLEATRTAYAAAGIAARVEPFIEDMAAAYAWADLVLCRAGALTIAELAAVGIASILVPYPYAVDDHQTRNAAYLADAGGAILLPQAELDAVRLRELLGALAADRPRLLAMALATRDRALLDATERVAALCLELARHHEGKA